MRTATPTRSLHSDRHRLRPPAISAPKIAPSQLPRTDGFLAGRDSAGSPGAARAGVTWLMGGRRWIIVRAGCDTAMLVLATVLASLILLRTLPALLKGS